MLMRIRIPLFTLVWIRILDPGIVPPQSYAKPRSLVYRSPTALFWAFFLHFERLRPPFWASTAPEFWRQCVTISDSCPCRSGSCFSLWCGSGSSFLEWYGSGSIPVWKFSTKSISVPWPVTDQLARFIKINTVTFSRCRYSGRQTS